MSNDLLNASPAPTRADASAPGSPNRTLTLLAGIGIGAAVMYFLDPDRGARRRALVRDKGVRALHLGQRELHDRAEDLRNRAVGNAAEVRGRYDDEPVGDEQLVARVRSELGHHVERPRAIEVAAEQGRVILRGQVPPDELDDVLATVRAVRGVRDVASELNVGDQATSRRD